MTAVWEVNGQLKKKFVNKVTDCNFLKMFSKKRREKNVFQELLFLDVLMFSGSLFLDSNHG